jgi:hypothetical protein
MRKMKNKFVSFAISAVLLFTLIPVAFRLGAVKPAYSNNTPFFKVEPQEIILKINGSIIEINVTVNNLEATSEAIGFQFRLCFNSTLLEFIDVSEGPFVPYWASQQPGSLGPHFAYTYDPSHPTYGPNVIVMDMILSNLTGQWNPPFPEGNGTIATLRFRSIYQELYLDRSSGKLPKSCDLALADTLILDTDENEIPHDVQNGLYTIWPRHIADLNIDGKVDLKDVYILQVAFGTNPTRPRWNPIADINKDSKIDLRDALKLYRAYNWVQDPWDP